MDFVEKAPERHAPDTPDRRAILRYVRRHQPCRAMDISRSIRGKSEVAVRALMSLMVKAGQLRRVSYGVYVTPDYEFDAGDVVIRNPVAGLAWLRDPSLLPFPHLMQEYDDVRLLVRAMRELVGNDSYPAALRCELKVMANVLWEMLPAEVTDPKRRIKPEGIEG